jgi:exopolyphosphatase/guanosine-5'-triphosphate,3'-diphosphate pyrophosphatase
MTRLGAGVDGDGRISDAKTSEIAETVARFAAGARARAADEVLATATAAAREAPNGDALAAAVEAASGVPLRIIDGDQEARLTFSGATRAGGAPVGTREAVIDIGGGSTEVVVGTVGGPLDYARSFRLGSGRLTTELAASDPPTDQDLARASRIVERVLPDDLPRVPEALVVGGSATSLARLGGGSLHGDALERAAAILQAAPSAVLARTHEVSAERARLLPAGLVILRDVAARLGARVEVGAGGIREGVIFAALDGPRAGAA